MLLKLLPFLSPADCDRLREIYADGLAAGRFAPRDSGHKTDVALSAVTSDLLYLGLADRVAKKLRAHYPTLPPLALDYAAYTRVRPGGRHTLHADAVKLDGVPNHTPHRIASAMLYLSNGFSGGVLRFPRLGEEIVPTPGLLVGFLTGLDHQHEVTEVAGGDRDAVAFWFRAASSQPTPKSLPTIGACAHLGERVPGQPCGSQLMRCKLHGGTTTRFNKCSHADRHCPTCEDNTTRAKTTVAAPAAPAPAFAPKPDDPPCGVVIGSYGWPELIDLQIRVIRDTCGPVPVCVSNDKPEANAELVAVCAKHPDVYLWPNAERIGHTGGDLSAFWKGIVWGAAKGLRVVAKLSQRFIATGPRWLQDGARDLLASGLPLASRRCRGREVWDLRTEACLLDVAQWNVPDVLARIAPRRYWRDSPKGLAAETVLNRVLVDLLGGIFWPWSLYSEERYARAPGTVWHCSHTRADYDALGRRYGVALPADFHVDGWQHDHAKGLYLHG